jgi:uncharacterized membrane protein
MSKALVLQYLIGVVLLVVFAFLNANFPGYTSLIFILYFVALMLVMFVLMGRQTRGLLKDLDEVKSGEVLYRSDTSEVLKLRERDLQNSQPELMAQFKASMIPFASLLILILVFYIPQLRDFFLQLGKVLAPANEKMASFFEYLLLYGFFYIVSLVSGFYARRLQSKTGTLVIATSYTVTSKGVVVDERMPVKFPLKGNILVDSRRKFVQLETLQQVMGTTVKQRIRLYSPEPSKLASLIKTSSTAPPASRDARAKTSGAC